MGKEEYNYHYDRSERTQHLSEGLKQRMENPPRKGIFKQNRGLTILLLDVLIILFIYFIALPFINASFSSATVLGYRFSLSGFVYENTCYLSIKVEAADPDKSVQGDFVTVVFSLQGSEKKTKVIDALPGEKGQTRIIRATLPIKKEEGTALAALTVGEEDVELSAKLKSETE